MPEKNNLDKNNNDNRKGAIDRFSRFCVKHRLTVLIIHILVAGIFLTGVLKIEGDVLLEDLLPYDHPYLKIIYDFSKDFGTGGAWVGIMLQNRDGDIFKKSILEKIVEINAEVATWPETYRALTFSIGSQAAQVAKASGEGQITVSPLMFPAVPASTEEIAQLKYDIFSDPNLKGIVSADGMATVIQTEFKSDVSYQESFRLLNTIKEKYSDDTTDIKLVGFPVLMGWIYSLKGQIVFAMIVSVVMMVLILWLIFRNLTGMMAPVAFGIISTSMGLGFIGFSGLNFSPLLYVLAFLVGARKTSHAVQVTHRYMEEYCACGDNKEACYLTMRAMIMPNWAGVVTDGAGFFILILVKIALMQQVAIFMTFWILAVATCGIFTPIVCSYIPMSYAAECYMQEKQQMGFLDRICTAFAQFSIGPGRGVVICGLAALLTFCIWQASGLKIGDPTPGSSLLWPDHPYNLSVNEMNQKFDSSSEDLVLYFSGNVEEAVYNSSKVLGTLDAFDRHMRETLPDLYKSSESFNAILKLINTTYRDGDVIWAELPYDTKDMEGLLGMSYEKLPLQIQRIYFDIDKTKANLSIYFPDHTSANLERIRNAAYAFFETYPMEIDVGKFQLSGGRIGMEIATNDEMKERHAKVEMMVLSSIFIICSLFFMSAVAGLMFTLPLVLANSIAFAYMAASDIGLSINTLPVAAVGVGVGVDFAIYIYNRCIEEFPRQDGWSETVMTAVRTSGKAVVFTGLTMVLPILVWFFISDLKFQAQMGLFLAMILSANVILSITLHPLLLVLIKPRFIKKMAKAKQEEVCRAGSLAKADSLI